ncbi:MAG: ComF family protein, partial [Caulobacteraceae bacterium]
EASRRAPESQAMQAAVEDAGRSGHGRADHRYRKRAARAKLPSGDGRTLDLNPVSMLRKSAPRGAGVIRGASLVRGALGRGLDLLMPPRALDQAAGGEAVQSAGLTAGAWSRIAFIEAPVCDGCGAPFDYEMGEGARCAACQGRRPAFDHARAACLYDDNAGGLILKLKHADRTDLSGLFARWIARAAADPLPELGGVVPVPLHRWRLLRRRYNQAAEIARPLARWTGLAYLPDALVRSRPPPSQGGRSGVGRRRNVAGAFAVPTVWKGRIEGHRLLVIDDVLTTGATVEGAPAPLRPPGRRGSTWR